MIEDHVRCYLVGGYVRDYLLGRESLDRDWVVVGGSQELMLAQNFIPVGRSFPVFLHPDTKEEYALARFDKKIAIGHTGFEFEFGPHVTLEQDLYRRDLTINAMALTSDLQIIDPYNGQIDLKNRVLRHVSNAFIEDPLRLLRVARFAAQLSSYNFTIAHETLDLLKQIVNSGELLNLSVERIWQETLKAINSDSPKTYFAILHEIGALDVVMPELNKLLINDIRYALVKAVKDANLQEKYILSSLFFDFDYALLLKFSTHMKLSTELKHCIELLNTCLPLMLNTFMLNAEQIILVLKKCNLFQVQKDQTELQNLILITKIFAKLNSLQPLSGIEKFWDDILKAISAVKVEEFMQDLSLHGKELGEKLLHTKISKIENYLKQLK